MKAAVIGGGAAGMMAAIAAAKKGQSVTIYEKNEKLGKKIYITGKGRCNCTNAAPIDEFFSNYISNPRFLYSSLYRFTNEDLMKMIEKEGIPLKTERGNRVFPVSDHASDITKALELQLKKLHVKVCLRTEVKSLLTEDLPPEELGPKEKYTKRVTGLSLSDGRRVPADAVIVCTGGLSYPTTGSTGDGYRFAREEGLKVTDLRPSLVPLRTEESDIYALQGLSLKNVSLTMPYGKNAKKQSFHELGEMMFTHFGITGPLVLKASARCGKYLEECGTLPAFIDFKPALSPDQLDQRLLRDFDQQPNKNLHTVMGGLLPARMIPVLLNRTGISDEKKVHDITKEERALLVDTLKHFRLTVNGTEGFRQAIVTQGGVSVKEISPSTMETKKVRGLYFAGEVLDIDGYTGGFNLQAAFSTGFLAGDGLKDLNTAANPAVNPER